MGYGRKSNGVGSSAAMQASPVRDASTPGPLQALNCSMTGLGCLPRIHVGLMPL